MIRLENITIANYRSFKDTGNKLDRLQQINVMVGKNNVGKTNVLRAIYLFFNPDLYNPLVDRNMIKQITGGAADDSKITIQFCDDEIITGKISKYKIICDINQKNKQYYSVQSGSKEVTGKLDSNKKIKDYLAAKIKCVYLSTTDEDIDKQSEDLLDDLILKYFQKKNKQVRQTIVEFEGAYKSLMETFDENINSIEEDLGKQFVDMEIVPKLSIRTDKEITKFLLENISLQLDDSYAQEIGTKGAGIQRASLIMLSIYLLNQIYARINKIILLDEPEAFLYPLLEKIIKDKLEASVEEGRVQIFLTSHSGTFLQEMNNSNYSFSFLKQVKEKKEYKRSKNDIDINKYTLVQEMNRHNRYVTLKNYGLLDDINDYEYVIVCEGPTDKNYIKKILQNKDDIPQIRYGKYSDGISGNEIDLNYNYVGKGASACLPILAYLDNVSEVHRKVFVLLDGDEEGREVGKKIHDNEYRNLEIKKLVLPDEKEIEDMVFTKEKYVERVLEVTPELKAYKTQFKKVIMAVPDGKSIVAQTESFISGNAINDVNIYKIKNLLSNNLHDDIEADWLLNEIDSFFYE